MIIGNSLANTHTKFDYNRFSRSEDTSNPRGGVKPEIRRRRRPKFAIGEMPVGPSAADGRAGERRRRRPSPFQTTVLLFPSLSAFEPPAFQLEEKP